MGLKQKLRLEITNHHQETRNQENTSTSDFNMHLPDLGLSISLKPKETKRHDPMENNTFAMSLPTFRFNVTVDTEPAQCIVGSAVINDF